MKGLGEASKTLEPQKFMWAPYAHFRLPTLGRHAHHETGTAPWVNDCRVQMFKLLVPQAEISIATVDRVEKRFFYALSVKIFLIYRALDS
jgi:hypothetical protein